MGLDWVIDEEGTQSSGEGQILHSLRDPEKGYPNGGPDSRLLCASIISAEVDGERYLTVSFLPESAANFDWEESRPFAWEDWEKHLKLATLLYGGFEREDELYWAASQLEVSSVTANDLLYQQLTGGYCRVRVSKMDRPSLPDEARMVTVTICESKEMYEKLVAEAEEKHQELQEKYSDVNAVG